MGIHRGVTTTEAPKFHTAVNSNTARLKHGGMAGQAVVMRGISAEECG